MRRMRGGNATMTGREAVESRQRMLNVSMGRIASWEPVENLIAFFPPLDERIQCEPLCVSCIKAAAWINGCTYVASVRRMG